MKYITIFLTAFLLKSCGNTKDVTVMQDTKEEQPIENITGQYLVTKLGVNDNLSHVPTLKFDKRTNGVSGFAGCNRFFGTYKKEGNSITFSQLGSTKMMCQEDANQIENKFLSALNEANQIEQHLSKLQVLRQLGHEVIIVDGGSTDNTVSLVSPLSRSFNSLSTLS